MIDFKNIQYLKAGNQRQQLAYEILEKYKVFTVLQHFNPVLAGTIPINIDIENSDLDIICYFSNKQKFLKTIKNNFAKFEKFKIKEKKQNVVIASFETENFIVEIYGQDIPVTEQNAYKHMIIENEILKEKGVEFRRKIIQLKKQGYKTEPAFAFLLDIKGDPYKMLLEYKNTKI